MRRSNHPRRPLASIVTQATKDGLSNHFLWTVFPAELFHSIWNLLFIFCSLLAFDTFSDAWKNAFTFTHTHIHQKNIIKPQLTRRNGTATDNIWMNRCHDEPLCHNSLTIHWNFVRFGWVRMAAVGPFLFTLIRQNYSNLFQNSFATFLPNNVF